MDKQAYQELYVGTGFGRTEFSQNFGRINGFDNLEYIGTFNSKNYSLFLQYIISPLDEVFSNDRKGLHMYFSGKLKWVMLDDIQGNHLQHFPYNEFGYKNPVKRDFLLLGQVGTTFRYAGEFFYFQQQMGYNYQGKYRQTSFKQIWLEFSAGFFLEVEKLPDYFKLEIKGLNQPIFCLHVFHNCKIKSSA